MTSSGICPSCQGEVTLYQEQLEDGTIYHAGKCWNCGCYVTEFPKGYDPIDAELAYEKRMRAEALERTIDEADRLGGISEWCRSGHNVFDFPMYSVRKEYDGKVLERSFYLEEAEAIGRAMCEDFYLIQRGQRTIKASRIDPDDRRVKGWVQFQIPYDRYAEDGDWYDFEFATRTVPQAIALLDHHRWDDCFRFRLNVGETTYQGPRDEYDKVRRALDGTE